MIRLSFLGVAFGLASLAQAAPAQQEAFGFLGGTVAFGTVLTLLVRSERARAAERAAFLSALRRIDEREAARFELRASQEDSEP